MFIRNSLVTLFVLFSIVALSNCGKPTALSGQVNPTNDPKVLGDYDLFKIDNQDGSTYKSISTEASIRIDNGKISARVACNVMTAETTWDHDGTLTLTNATKTTYHCQKDVPFFTFEDKMKYEFSNNQLILKPIDSRFTATFLRPL